MQATKLIPYSWKFLRGLIFIYRCLGAKIIPSKFLLSSMVTVGQDTSNREMLVDCPFMKFYSLKFSSYTVHNVHNNNYGI